MSDRTTLDWAAEPDGPVPPPTWGRRAPEAQVLPWVFAALGGFLLIGNLLLSPHLTAPALSTWSTIFVAICVQAIPFLVLGVTLSAAITAFVPPSFFRRALPGHPYAAVPVAGAAGLVLPGCECASVPVASSLMSRGVTPSAALAFLLASPAINPVVLVATAVAFPGEPLIVLARFAASLAVAVLAGWAWQLLGRPGLLRVPDAATTGGSSRRAAFLSAMRHDFLHAGGFLVVGGLTAATLNVVVPRSWLAAVADNPWLSVLVLAALAVVLSICSEADAFVAASLTGFSPTARLAFMVVGPMVDLKLIALQAGTFGRAFAARFVPLTFTLAIAVSVLVGWVLL
ncbi:permease [Sphaerisporangium melleum]|uniref:Permease n=1 Tax=Sphaerisporangium melleum TaxID=321316 RepID=A0A917VL09_9ACTN|nr:permease [Sphaerisporangium melleum]GGK92234.1 permease [Sphaerisporangium melleum]GII72991.1 permease [Sphaerisporangium melleum]